MQTENNALPSIAQYLGTDLKREKKERKAREKEAGLSPRGDDGRPLLSISREQPQSPHAAPPPPSPAPAPLPSPTAAPAPVPTYSPRLFKAAEPFVAADIADDDKGIAFYGIPKFELQGKLANRLKILDASMVSDGEVSKAGVLEIEEGKLLKSWKKTKVVLKNNRLYSGQSYEGEKGERSFGLDELVKVEADPKRGEAVFALQWSDRAALVLRAESQEKMELWLLALQRSRSVHHHAQLAPSLCDALVLIAAPYSDPLLPPRPFAFDFLQHTHYTTYLGIAGAVLAELFLRHKIKLGPKNSFGEPKVLLFDDNVTLTGDSLLDDLLLFIKSQQSKGVSVKGILRSLQKPKDAEPIIGDMWKRAIARCLKKNFIAYNGQLQFTVRADQTEQEYIDCIRAVAFNSKQYPATPRELSFIGITYAVARVMRKLSDKERVVAIDKIFRPEELRGKLYLNALQSAMDRFANGFHNVDSTAAMNIREICSSVYYCGREKK